MTDTENFSKDRLIEHQNEAEEARLLQRNSFILPIIEERLPDKDFEEVLAQKYNIPKAKLDEDDRGYAQRLLFELGLERKHIATAVAESQEEDENLLNYTSKIFQLAEILADTPDIDPRDAKFLAQRIQSTSRVDFFTELALQWKQRFLVGDPAILKYKKKVDIFRMPSIYEKRISVINKFIADTSNYNSEVPERTLEEISALSEQMIDVYDYIYAISNESNEDFTQKVAENAVELGLRSHNPEKTKQYFSFFKEVADDPDQQSIELFMTKVWKYARNHQLTDEVREGFIQSLLPALKRKDPQVSILINGGNVWSMTENDFGVGDFLCHTFAKRVTPENLNELLMAAKQVPTTNEARLEQNRLDGLSLMVFRALRDFIHDQRPGVHDVISSMVAYYDNPTEENRQIILSNMKTYMTGPDGEALNYGSYLDQLDVYESIVEETVNGQQRPVKAIEIVRRVKENTEPFDDLPPLTSDEVLNNLMQSFTEKKGNKESAEKGLYQVTNYLNNRLLEMMKVKQIGIEPNVVLALGWLDRQGARFLQGLSYEDQQGAYKMNWFQELLKFQELTNSTGEFNEADFDRFIHQLNTLPFDRDTDLIAYRMISRRVLLNVAELGKKYKNEKKFVNTFSALWSGNLTDQFIGLTDLREATTVYGKEHRNERFRSEMNRNQGE